MDILEWVLRQKPKEKQLPRVSSLKQSIRVEMGLFHKLWTFHEEKRDILNAYMNNGKSSELKELIRINEKLLKVSRDILQLDTLMESMAKKIMYEAVERLHDAEGSIWRHGTRWDPDNNRIAGQRMPHNIEHLKKAAWAVVGDEEKLSSFVDNSLESLKEQFRALLEAFQSLRQNIEMQNKDLEILSKSAKNIEKEQIAGLMQAEERSLLGMRKVLIVITNKLLLSAKIASDMQIEQERIASEIPGQEKEKKVGIMLFHAIVSKSADTEQYAAFLKKNGCIVYSLRLPGHYGSIEEFFNTPLGEIESFMISAFKYFYLYMQKINNGDGRFYVAGPSIGSMVSIHVCAKRWNGKYPYQGMVKGMILMSPYIILSGSSKLGRFEPMTNSIVTRLYKYHPKLLLTQAHKLEKPFEDIRDRLNRAEISKEGALVLIRQVVTGYILDLKKTFLDKGSAFLTSKDDEVREIETITSMVFRNIEQGKNPIISKGDVNDLKALLDRENFPVHSTKLIQQMGVLGLQLREDVKHLQVPLLILYGIHDKFADPKGAEYIYKNCQTRRGFKWMVPLEKSGHIPVVDYDKEKVFQETVKFIEFIEEEYKRTERKSLRRLKSQP